MSSAEKGLWALVVVVLAEGASACARPADAAAVIARTLPRRSVRSAGAMAEGKRRVVGGRVCMGRGRIEGEKDGGCGIDEAKASSRTRRMSLSLGGCRRYD
jgi:hypothetical protein